MGYLWGVSWLAAAVVAVLILAVVWLSLARVAPAGGYSLSTYVRLLHDSSVVETVWNTVGFALVTTLVSLAFGVAIAWLVARTDLPGRNLVRTGMLLGILVPGFASAMGWIFFLDPRIGMFNRLLQTVFRDPHIALNVASIPGMGWVQGLSLAPVAYIFTVGIFRTIDPALEEAGIVSGAGSRAVLRSVTLPLMAPALVAAALYIFTLAFGIFDVPGIIGFSNRIFTVSTLIYLYVQPLDGLPQYNHAAALGMVAVVFALLFSLVYGWVVRLSFRYQSVSGKGFRPRVRPLGRGRGLALAFVTLYFLLAFAMPVLLTLWASLLPYVGPPSLALLRTASLDNFRRMPVGLMLRGAQNSVILMALTPTLALAVGGCMAWIVARTRSAMRFVVDFTAYVPHAIPESVFAVGAMILALFVLRSTLPIYGTIWLILLVYVVVRLAFSVRLMTAAVLQVSPELEEAAYVSGVSFAGAVRWVTGPLLAPTLSGLWVWMALLALRDLTAAALLVTSSNLTLPVVIWSLWNGGQQTESAAASLVLLAVTAPLVWAFWHLVDRAGIERSIG